MMESPVIVCVHSFIYTDSYTHSHKHTHRHTHTLTQLHILTHTPDFCWGFNMLKFHTVYILTRKMFDELQNQYKTILIKTTQKFSETVRLVYRKAAMYTATHRIESTQIQSQTVRWSHTLQLSPRSLTVWHYWTVKGLPVSCPHSSTVHSCGSR